MLLCPIAAEKATLHSCSLATCSAVLWPALSPAAASGLTHSPLRQLKKNLQIVLHSSLSSFTHLDVQIIFLSYFPELRCPSHTVCHHLPVLLKQPSNTLGFAPLKHHPPCRMASLESRSVSWHSLWLVGLTKRMVGLCPV